jgi:alpha-glucosidase
VLVAEAWVWNLAEWAAFWGTASDELDMAFNFKLLDASFEPDALRAVVEQTEAALPVEAWPALTGSNHDVGRLTTRWCHGSESLARCALLMLLTLRGTPFLYFGDELALADGDVPQERIVDCASPSRDPCRTPMPWTPAGGWHDPWLPLSDTSRNVEAERGDPTSTLHFTRDLIALRRRLPDLAQGDYQELAAPRGTWAWRRGQQATVAVNLGRTVVSIDGIAGAIVLATTREREGERVDGRLWLEPATGVVVRP